MRPTVDSHVVQRLRAWSFTSARLYAFMLYVSGSTVVVTNVIVRIYMVLVTVN